MCDFVQAIFLEKKKTFTKALLLVVLGESHFQVAPGFPLGPGWTPVHTKNASKITEYWSISQVLTCATQYYTIYSI